MRRGVEVRAGVGRGVEGSWGRAVVGLGLGIVVVVVVVVVEVEVD